MEHYLTYLNLTYRNLTYPNLTYLNLTYLNLTYLNLHKPNLPTYLTYIAYQNDHFDRIPCQSVGRDLHFDPMCP